MKLTIWTKAFWAATGERVLRTAAGALIALLTADGFNLLAADWVGIGSAVGLASLVSLLLAITGNVATKEGPAFTSAEQTVPPTPTLVPDPDPEDVDQIDEADFDIDLDELDTPFGLSEPDRFDDGTGRR